MEDKELQLIVEEISQSIFGKPFRHKALFNDRLRTTGGRYLLRSHNIEINKKYLDQLGQEELIGIIKHELCHYHLHLEKKGYQHRDADFRELLSRVGAPRFCSKLPDSPVKRRSTKLVLYKCKSCGLDYKRRRAINTNRYGCGRCRGKLAKIGEWRAE